MTPLALAAAAQSDDLETFRYFLKLGDYYHARGDLSENKIATLTDPMKDAIEDALQEALRRGRYKVLPELLAFLDRRRNNKEHQWTTLEDGTVDALVESLWHLAAYDDEEHMKTFNLICDGVLGQTSRFATAGIVDRKFDVLNDAYFRAAQEGCLEMMKLIEDKHPTLEVNHPARWSNPKYTSPLYIAAGAERRNIVEHLLDTHGEILNVHLGAGEFANGPTALWSAVFNGRSEIARLLLERVGGPVDIVGPGFEPGESKSRIVLTAKRDLHGHKGLASETASIAIYGDLGDGALEGSVKDENGGEGKHVLLDFEEGDRTWWEKMQVRKSDEELLLMEVSGRTLRGKDVPV